MWSTTVLPPMRESARETESWPSMVVRARTSTFPRYGERSPSTARLVRSGSCGVRTPWFRRSRFDRCSNPATATAARPAAVSVRPLHQVMELFGGHADYFSSSASCCDQATHSRPEFRRSQRQIGLRGGPCLYGSSFCPVLGLTYP